MAFNKCVSTLPIRNGNFLLHSYASPIRGICEYLTYKEWKRIHISIIKIICSRSLVSTLPIRNGNGRLPFLTDMVLLFPLCEYLTYKEWKR